jgi:hypothetical protein
MSSEPPKDDRVELKIGHRSLVAVLLFILVLTGVLNPDVVAGFLN